MKIRLASYLQPDSIVDGEGIRTVIWTQGCSHNCKGCHNPTTHDFKGGFEVDTEELIEDLSKLEGQEGITFSGGDPLFQVEALPFQPLTCRPLLNIPLLKIYSHF